MDRRTLFQAAGAVVLGPFVKSSFPKETIPDPKLWVRKAESLKPALSRSTKAPVEIVRPIAEPGSFLRWKMEPLASAASLKERVMRAGDTCILDFGGHVTGRFALSLAPEGAVNAPARLKLTFGEVPAEVAEPFDPFEGLLSRAWLQDETVTVDVLPARIRLPRRYAFRYVKIEVLAPAADYALRLSEPEATSLTSAFGTPAALPAGVDDDLQRIDAVSIATLRECMQTVFEDGPKRDRRLWIGDLRLQALVNYATFRNFDLVRRCLYLFAGLPRDDGLVPALVAEDPMPLRGHEYIIDYAGLYCATVLDYARASKDWRTSRELWPVVRRQIEILSSYVGADNLFAAPPGSWVFIDWNDALDRTAPMHGIYVFALRQASELARAVGAEREATRYLHQADRSAKAARLAFLDSESRQFVSGPTRQVSWATQAWMVLAGIATLEEGRTALQAVKTLPSAVRPVTPYLYHYVAEAMIGCGMAQEALDLVRSYWGGMVRAGADTFWEIYDPVNPTLSPYGNVLLNSYCHAWSCTPAYLLRSGLLHGS